MFVLQGMKYFFQLLLPELFFFYVNIKVFRGSHLGFPTFGKFVSIFTSLTLMVLL